MGWPWEVEMWEPSGEGYRYTQVYYGGSLFQAIRAMRKAKKTSGCVRLSWR